MSDSYVTHFISQTDIVTATLLHSINHTDEFNWLFLKLILSFYKHLSSSFFGWGGGVEGGACVASPKPPPTHPIPYETDVFFNNKSFLSQRTIQNTHYTHYSNGAIEYICISIYTPNCFLNGMLNYGPSMTSIKLQLS